MSEKASGYRIGVRNDEECLSRRSGAHRERPSRLKNRWRAFMGLGCPSDGHEGWFEPADRVPIAGLCLELSSAGPEGSV